MMKAIGGDGSVRCLAVLQKMNDGDDDVRAVEKMDEGNNGGKISTVERKISSDLCSKCQKKVQEKKTQPVG